MMQMLSPVIITTADGSHSVGFENTKITFHSAFGACTESRHVFINSGLNYYLENRGATELRILEMGFGTGLNALLTALCAAKLQKRIRYVSLDLFPLNIAMLQQLNYGAVLNAAALYESIIGAPWNKPVNINDHFCIEKRQQDLLTWRPGALFDICFFDAFAPNDQPELWTEAVFKQIREQLTVGGVLTTYCSKSVVRKALLQAGFTVEKLKGPPGKREILRAGNPTSYR